MNQFELDNKLVLGYPILVLVFMWSMHLLNLSVGIEFYEYGLYPRALIGLIGVFTSPFIHSTTDFNHILSNSVPILILLASIIHFYRPIALKVILIVWLGGGLLTWIYARENYHIGMSGVIYGLVGFLFFSGILRKYKPLLGLSLFVVFIYGSLIWGVFPMQERVSWEGHLSGLILGVLAAIIYRKEGPQQPKYRYEIEKEMGIEPIDYEKIWRENVAQQERENALSQDPKHSKENSDAAPIYQYRIISKNSSE